MASTPKNPLDQSDHAGPSHRELKPVVPPYDGGQFARDFATPPPIAVNHDRFNDEMTTDRPSHEGCTPGHSNPTYTGRQFSDDWEGGYENYGVTVKDMGQSPSKEQVAVNPHSADRGKES